MKVIHIFLGILLLVTLLFRESQVNKLWIDLQVK